MKKPVAMNQVALGLPVVEAVAAATRVVPVVVAAKAVIVEKESSVIDSFTEFFNLKLAQSNKYGHDNLTSPEI